MLLPVFQVVERRGLVGCHQHSCGRKRHVSEKGEGDEDDDEDEVDGNVVTEG